jgi:hypothetical protein
MTKMCTVSFRRPFCSSITNLSGKAWKESRINLKSSKRKRKTRRRRLKRRGNEKKDSKSRPKLKTTKVNQRVKRLLKTISSGVLR